MPENEPRIRLVTRADDAGSNRTANEAIRECLDAGFLKNVSVMAVGKAVEHAAELLAGREDACFGLHTALNAEWDQVRWGPVLPPQEVPSLVDDAGMLLPTTRALKERGPSEGEVMAEVQAQLDRLRSLGFDIRYADMHMGWGWVLGDGFGRRFDAWCEREGLLYYRPRHRNLPAAATGTDVGDRIDQFIARLRQAPAGQYAVVGHPANDNEEMRALGHEGYAGDVVAKERVWERKLFTDPRVLDLWHSGEVRPIRYDEAEPIP